MTPQKFLNEFNSKVSFATKRLGYFYIQDYEGILNFVGGHFYADERKYFVSYHVFDGKKIMIVSKNFQLRSN